MNKRTVAERIGRFIGDVMEIGGCLIFGIVYLFVHAIALLFVLRIISIIFGGGE